MASGSSGRASNSGSKPFDFASDDILCSYEDYGNQDGNNGTHSDPSITGNPSKEFHKSRMARSSVFPSATYSPPEESSSNQDILSTVENTMKKYADNLMRFLEGISSRLSQLELYCYNLDKSIKEMHSDLVHDHGESDSKLKSLEKHVQEVHRSVQVLRDKQELAETQKELAKLQLAQKESSSTGNTQKNEEKSSAPPSEAKTSDSSSDAHNNNQLALALPHQVAPRPALPAWPVEQHQQPPMAPQSSIPPQSMGQMQTYYLAAPQMTNQPAPPHQYLPAQSQMQDPSRMQPQQAQSQVNPAPQVQSLPQYQQQWAQQPHQPVQPAQQAVMQSQIRPSSQPVYTTYLSAQPNQSPAGMAPNSMPMQVSFAVGSQPGPTGPEAMHYVEPNKPYGYGGTGRPIQQKPPVQHFKTGYETQSVDGYVPSGPRPALPPGSAYMMYESEGGRTHHPSQQQQLHFQQSPYPPPTNVPLQQNPQRMPGGPNMGGPQSVRAHPYNELIEKLVNMGYRGEHILGVIQRLEESGENIDFNAVLDRLNGHSSGGSQRGWSG